MADSFEVAGCSASGRLGRGPANALARGLALTWHFSDELILEKMASTGIKEAMKKSRFSEAQMVKILQETDEAPVAEVAKKHGVSDVTIYGGRKRFGKLEAVDVKRVRRIEGEKAKLLAERPGDRQTGRGDNELDPVGEAHFEITEDGQIRKYVSLAGRCRKINPALPYGRARGVLVTMYVSLGKMSP